MSPEIIPMAERPKFGELDLFTQLAARVAEAEKSAREGEEAANRAIEFLRLAIADMGMTVADISNRVGSLADRVGVAETMAKDARDSANAAELLLDGLTGPAKESEPVAALPAATGAALDPGLYLSVAEFLSAEGSSVWDGLTPKGIAKVMGVAAVILGVDVPRVHGNLCAFPVFLLRSFARFLESKEFKSIGRSANFAKWAMAEDEAGRLRP